jgi:TolB-like protein/class 3 adenylate cyclase/Tfp pilus assembly protein PilF
MMWSGRSQTPTISRVSAEVKKEIELEIAYVLFIDIVGYSKLLIDQQRRLLELLNEVVRGTEQFRKAEANHRLITIPTGDGMALVFYNTPEAPVECALETSRAVKEHPQLKLRMGVHSGPVSGVVDVSGRGNIAGAGINVAQRVMDCGDAEHILLSKHVAEDLEQLGHWQRHLHDLGDCEVKHGARVSVVNLYTEELGNPEVPQKFRQARKSATPIVQEKKSRGWIFAVAGLLVATLITGVILWSRYSVPTGTATTAAPTASTTSMSTAVAVPEKSIAVLPFDNLSRDPDNAFFTDGVQDEILTALAKVADLKVISRSSVMQYKSDVARDLRKIGAELGVAHLLEGSVQRANNRVRVNAQLIDTRNNAHLWAQTYDRDLADVFAIQSEIAKAIADQLQAKLSPSEKSAIEQRPTNDVAAFDLYSRAKNLMLTTAFSAIAGKKLDEAVSLLNQALQRDPSFFVAQCDLARAHDQLYALGLDHTPARLATAGAAVDAAIRLRPEAGEAHLVRAQHLYYGYRNYDGALKELELARQTLPNNPEILELTGYILRRRGKSEEGLQFIQRALDLDPRNFYTLLQIAISYAYLRQYAEQTAVLDRALAVKPDDVETRVGREVIPLDWKADTRPLHRIIDETRAQTPGALQNIADVWVLCAFAERDPAGLENALRALGTNTWGDNATLLSVALGEGLLARLQHDEEKARAAFTRAREEQQKLVQADPNFAPPICILGLIDAGLGRKKEALEEAQRAIDLLPVTKDLSNGTDILQYGAIVAAWAGEKDLACERLSAAVSHPSVLSYGRLKLLPWWDSLRGDPRFEKIVNSLAPKL